MKKQIIYSILLLFLLGDAAYSFVQHLSQTLDGDMAWNIVPADEVKPILESPFGTGVILKNQIYPNPNRFFCHYSIKKYFETVPIFLQKFVNPVDSIYLSCAIFKIIIQLFLIILLAIAITGKLNFLSIDFLIAAVLVTPLFQTEGYQSYMGIIDRSPTYTFFYAMPLALLLFYFTPFILQYFHKQKLKSHLLIYILWIPFALIICLSGPLNPGIVIIFSFLVFINQISKNYIQSGKKGILTRFLSSVAGIPGNNWFYLLPISIISLYSLYIGSFNSNNVKLPLIDLYSRIPAGIYNPLTKKLGFPVLLSILALNLAIIHKSFKNPEGRRISGIFKWIGIYTLIYILLLPLGGFRYARPYVLRYDTFMPVTVSLAFMFGISSLFLLKNLKGKKQILYILVVTGVLIFFNINDERQFSKNQCERSALKEISESADSIVRLKSGCNVLAWEKTSKPEDSELNARLLVIWKVTKSRKLYFNE